MVGLGLCGVGLAHEEGPWGCDAELAYPRTVVCRREPSSFGGWAIRGAVSFHQMVLSESDGPRSHFRPSSSQYMLLAVQKYGWGEGVLRGLDRLMRENDDPWVYPRLATSPTQWIKWDPP